MISIIVAIADNGVIGNNNSLPWHLPVDLKYFRKTTMGHSIVMGRRNHEDIGRPLPGRHNIVLTRSKNYVADGCDIVHSVEEVMSKTGKNKETFIIGGAEIYDAFLPYTTKMYITHIDTSVQGNVVFPEYDTTEWKQISENLVPADIDNSLHCRFCVYQRINNL